MDAATQKVKKPKYIYYLYGKKSKAIKIGYTQDPIKRIFVINSLSPEPLILIKLTPGSKIEEYQIHKKFHGIRLHGEWFKATKELFQFIDEQSGWEGAAVQRALTTHGRMPDEVEAICGREIEPE